MTHHTLADAGSSLSWAALRDFVYHLRDDSATWRSARPDSAEQMAWRTGEVDAILLARILDAVNTLTYVVGRVGGAKPKKPTPTKTPFGGDDNTKHFGKDPIPIDQFDEWWEGG